MNNEQHDYLWQKIKSIKVGMLTSRDGDILRSRPMYLAQNHFTGTLWFFTQAGSHKNLEINKQSDVNVSFMDVDEDEYVSVSGQAHLSRDQSIIDELWNPMVAAWFSDGKDSGAVRLLQIDVKAAEVWDAQEGEMKQMAEAMKLKERFATEDTRENVKLS